MTRLQFKSTPLVEGRVSELFEVKFADGDGLVAGYGATFNDRPDVYGDVIAPGAFAHSLASHRSAGSLPAMLWGHDPSHVVGRWDAADEDEVGLRVKGRFNLATQAGLDAYKHVKHGDVTGLSIGYSGSSRKANADGSQTILKAHLHEISLTPIPANGRAQVTEVKRVGSRAELVDVLHDVAGLPRKAAQKIAFGGWGALAGEPQAPDGSEERKALAALIKRATADVKTWKGHRS